jgi:enamine deaminase RidA (YjgF/YER057c/UK114 family)
MRTAALPGYCIRGALAAGSPPQHKTSHREHQSMKIERHEVGPRMSQVVVHGDTVHLAGIVAQKNAGKSVAEQTKEILETIDGYLQKAGTDKSKLITANIWLASMDTFAEMNSVWDTWVVPGQTPARATVQARLAAPQYAVEIMVTAAR